MMAFQIKRGDVLPHLRAVLRSASGKAVDITTADAVNFYMRGRGTITKQVAGTAAVIDGARGIVEYTWAAGNTDTAGVFWAEFEVLWIGGQRQTFPSGEYIDVEVLADLGP